MTTTETRNDRLVIESLSKSYGQGEDHKLVLDSIDLEVRSGEFMTIVGPSGCGKSTLLMIMAGLLEASSGTVELAGKPVTSPPRSLAVVFQDYSRSLFPWMTIEKNLRLAGKACGLGGRSLAEGITTSLESVGLAGSERLFPWQMSGGMQQRAAIARAILIEPSWLFMDEPFAAVDAQTRADLEDLVRQLHERSGMGVVFVTHDIDEAVYVADRVLVLEANPGRINADLAVELPGPRDQVRTKSLAEFARLRASVFERVMRRPHTDLDADQTHPLPPTERSNP